MAGKSKAEKAGEALLAKAIELSGVAAEAFAALSEEEKAGFTAKAQEVIDAAAAEAKRLADENKAAAKAQEDEVDNSHLIKVSKEGVELDVHPTALVAHKGLGWKEV